MKRPVMYMCQHSQIDITNLSLFSGDERVIHVCRKNKYLGIFTRKERCPKECEYFKLKPYFHDQLKACGRIANSLGLQSYMEDN